MRHLSSPTNREQAPKRKSAQYWIDLIETRFEHSHATQKEGYVEVYVLAKFADLDEDDKKILRKTYGLIGWDDIEILDASYNEPDEYERYEVRRHVVLFKFIKN